MKMTQDELQSILALHAKWIYSENGGKRANLRSADLRSANLRSADLRSANLRSADLRSADLRSADLRSADLRSANLRSADLRSANLYGANLYGADLSGADLSGANLYDADLSGANLYGADLYGADLYGADLYGADLRSVENISPLTAAQTDILPQGDIIGYKKCQTVFGKQVLVKLLIPFNAKRCNATGRKCRAEFAIVQQMEGINFVLDTKNEKVVSQYDCSFEYAIGKELHPVQPFCDDRWQECASGIHFFITKEEAINY